MGTRQPQPPVPGTSPPLQASRADASSEALVHPGLYFFCQTLNEDIQDLFTEYPDGRGQ